jgi:S-adenosylmethionine:tRNA ribosyltransferase-isomerase
MALGEFNYALPAAAIAQVPAEPRDSARLLVDRGPDSSPLHRRVSDLPGLLREGDLLVVNDTRVLPARLRSKRATGGVAEILLLEPLAEDLETWEALVRPGRRLGEGERLELGPGDAVVVGPRRPAGTREVRIEANGPPLDAIQRHGTAPLPPYITTPLDDPERYQTVYAQRPASVAAPTAGLHLTSEVLAKLEATGVGLARVELVVGLDTFRPIAVDDPADHVMHSEAFSVPRETNEAVARTRARGGRVIAVGTTTVRALESTAARGELSGRTDLFIRRPYPWTCVDVLLTNFHQPRSTLLVLVDAFVGPRWRDLYAEALASGYRFLSFGDAMLLERSS